MPATPQSIPISGLNTDALLQSQDFFPLVNSASLTTYRASIQSIGNWMLASGSCSSSLYSISSSYAGFSISALSSSWATQSISSSYLNGTATASVFGTSSWAINSVNALNAISATYVPTQNLSLYSISSSWASSSYSSSYLYGGGYLFGTSSWSINSQTASYLNGQITASVFGTSSWAVSASHAIFTPTFLRPQTVLVGSGISSPLTGAINMTPYVVGNPNFVILSAYLNTGPTTATSGYITIGENTSNLNPRYLIGWWSNAANATFFTAQAIFPIVNNNIYYKFPSIDSGVSSLSWTIYLVGYF